VNIPIINHYSGAILLLFGSKYCKYYSLNSSCELLLSSHYLDGHTLKCSLCQLRFRIYLFLQKIDRHLWINLGRGRELLSNNKVAYCPLGSGCVETPGTGHVACVGDSGTRIYTFVGSFMLKRRARGHLQGVAEIKLHFVAVCVARAKTAQVCSR
jgi:hypothetical protein